MEVWWGPRGASPLAQSHVAPLPPGQSRRAWLYRMTGGVAVYDVHLVSGGAVHHQVVCAALQQLLPPGDEPSPMSHSVTAGLLMARPGPWPTALPPCRMHSMTEKDPVLLPTATCHVSLCLQGAHRSTYSALQRLWPRKPHNVSSKPSMRSARTPRHAVPGREQRCCKSSTPYQSGPQLARTQVHACPSKSRPWPSVHQRAHAARRSPLVLLLR